MFGGALFAHTFYISLHSPSNSCQPHLSGMLLVLLVCKCLHECVSDLFWILAAFSLDNPILDQVTDLVPLCGYVFGPLMELWVPHHQFCSHVVPFYLCRHILGESKFLTQVPQP